MDLKTMTKERKIIFLCLLDSLLDWTAVLLGVPTASVRLESSSGVTGTISIEQVWLWFESFPHLIDHASKWAGHVRIHGRVFGLSAGLHGIHVHAVGDTSDNCLAAGGHFNPDAVRPKLSMQMSGWQMANILGGTWGKVWSSPFSHLPLSSYSKIEPDMMQSRC